MLPECQNQEFRGTRVRNRLLPNPAAKIALLLTVTALLPAMAVAQGGWRLDRTHYLSSDSASSGTIAPLAGVGDINQDGFGDYLVGRPHDDVNGIAAAGRVVVYSGASHEQMGHIKGTEHFGQIGRAAAAAGDVDGDGVPDLLAGTSLADGPNGQVSVGFAGLYSGATFSPIWTWSGSSQLEKFGSSLAASGDVDGDGVTDLVVGASSSNAPGSVHVFSGQTGARILQVSGSSPDDRFGYAVAGLGDVDGDGRADILIGAPGLGGDPGYALAVSGASGRVIWQLDGATAHDNFGRSVSSIGDQDGDGIRDAVIGAPYADPNGMVNAGVVLVVSGVSGQVIREYAGANSSESMGFAVAEAGDVNGDGHIDLLVGAPDAGYPSHPNWSAGLAFVYSGASGDLLCRIGGTPIFDGRDLASSVAGAGDLNGDGFPDILLGDPHARQNGLGKACVYVVETDPFLRLSSEVLSVSGSCSLPVTAYLDFPASEGGQAYVLLASRMGNGPATLGGIQIPLSLWDPLTRKMLHGWNPALLLYGSGYLDLDGRAKAFLFSSPSLTPWIGTTLFLAAVTWDPVSEIGRKSSRAVSLRIVP